MKSCAVYVVMSLLILLSEVGYGRNPTYWRLGSIEDISLAVPSIPENEYIFGVIDIETQQIVLMHDPDMRNGGHVKVARKLHKGFPLNGQGQVGGFGLEFIGNGRGGTAIFQPNSMGASGELLTTNPSLPQEWVEPHSSAHIGGKSIAKLLFELVRIGIRPVQMDIEVNESGPVTVANSRGGIQLKNNLATSNVKTNANQFDAFRSMHALAIHAAAMSDFNVPTSDFEKHVSVGTLHMIRSSDQTCNSTARSARARAVDFTINAASKSRFGRGVWQTVPFGTGAAELSVEVYSASGFMHESSAAFDEGRLVSGYFYQGAGVGTMGVALTQFGATYLGGAGMVTSSGMLLSGAGIGVMVAAGGYSVGNFIHEAGLNPFPWLLSSITIGTLEGVESVKSGYRAIRNYSNSGIHHWDPNDLSTLQSGWNLEPLSRQISKGAWCPISQRVIQKCH